MVKTKFTALIALFAVLMPTLSACASTGSPSGPPTELSMSPQQLAQTPTENDVILDTQMEFDENGIALPPRPLTATEAIMTAQIEQHCVALVHERIRGEAGSMMKKTTLGAILMGIGTAVGSMFLPFTKPLQYLGYGGASGAASGAFSGALTIEQARSVANSYCQLMQVTNLRATGDSRLKRVIVIPIIGLKGSRPSVNWKVITPTPTQREMIENEANAPPPVVP